MEKSTKNARLTDPVDWFADEIMRNPDRASDLKEALRHQMGIVSSHGVDHGQSDEDEADDIWDNVPV